MTARSGLAEGFSALLGWTYFALWSLSFYPQVILNARRKSVVGLSLDFQLLNILGYTCYSVYNVELHFNAQTRAAYADAFGEAVSVGLPDVFFALHGGAMTLITIVQCCVYDRGTQKLSWLSIGSVGLALVLTCAYAIAVVASAQAETPTSTPAPVRNVSEMVGLPLRSGSVSIISWLAWLYWLSIIKLVVTCSKYMPQVPQYYHYPSTRLRSGYRLRRACSACVCSLCTL